MSPPMRVTVIQGSPPRIAKPADSVLNGRLRGSMTLGLRGLSVNSAPRLCSMMPKPGTVMPEPKTPKLLFTHDTMLPSLSAVESTTVSPGRVNSPSGPGVDACCGSIFPHRVDAYDSDNNLVSGTATKSGSAL